MTDLLDAPHVSVASLIEALPDALLVVDVHGVIFLVNAQTEWLFGRPRSELIGSPVENFMPERFRDRHKTYREHYNSEPKVRPMGMGSSLFILQRNDKEIGVAISISPLMTPKGMFVLAILRRQSDKLSPDPVDRRHHDPAEATKR